MRYDSDHKARTRERVLKEAAAAIRTEGATGIGVAAVMARAGLTQGGFYAHFKSKDDLIAQAIGTMFDERYAALFAHSDTADPRETLTTFLDGYLSIRHRDAPEKGCPIPVLSGELPRLPQDARRKFEGGVERLAAVLAKLIERMGKTQDARSLALSVLAEIVGAMALARACRTNALSAAILANARDSIGLRLGL